jgi:hypothetical protein
MTRNERLTLILSAAAILLSTLSLGYTIWSDWNAQQDDIAVTLDYHAGRHESFIIFSGGQRDAWIRTNWVLTMINNGSQKASISALSFDADTEQSDSTPLFGLISVDSTRLRLPISIGSGESIRLVAKVGYPLEGDVKKCFPDLPDLEVFDLLSTPSRHSHDGMVGVVQKGAVTDTLATARCSNSSEPPQMPLDVEVSTSRGQSFTNSAVPVIAFPNLR